MNRDNKKTLETYGNGPAALLKGNPDVYRTNIAGVPWYFQTSKEYKELKQKIREERKSRK